MEWQREIREIKTLRENPDNPRRLSTKQGNELKNSLSKFGQCEPIVIQPDGTIIGGHQRCRVLKKMGEKSVDTYVPNEPLSDAEVKELTIRLNKNQGDWDFDMLANLWEVDLLLESGFTTEELHLEIVEEEKKPTKFTLAAKFENEDDLREAEIDIKAVISKYNTASYKVNIK
jgi:ParB-like chromosome segregation protein Spo0J